MDDLRAKFGGIEKLGREKFQSFENVKNTVDCYRGSEFIRDDLVFENIDQDLKEFKKQKFKKFHEQYYESNIAKKQWNFE